MELIIILLIAVEVVIVSIKFFHLIASRTADIFAVPHTRRSRTLAHGHRQRRSWGSDARKAQSALVNQHPWDYDTTICCRSPVTSHLAYNHPSMYHTFIVMPCRSILQFTDRMRFIAREKRSRLDCQNHACVGGIDCGCDGLYFFSRQT